MLSRLGCRLAGRDGVRKELNRGSHGTACRLLYPLRAQLSWLQPHALASRPDMQPPSPTQAVLLPYILMLFADVCPSPPQTRTRCWILSTAIYAPEARPVPAIARYAGFPLQPRPNLVTKSNHHRQNPVPLLTDPSPSPSRLQLQKRDVGLTKLRTELEQSEARRQELEFELCLARERQQQLQVCWGEGADLVLRQFDNTPPFPTRTTCITPRKSSHVYLARRTSGAAACWRPR